jgi:hypothetical protein
VIGVVTTLPARAVRRPNILLFLLVPPIRRSLAALACCVCAIFLPILTDFVNPPAMPVVVVSLPTFLS